MSTLEKINKLKGERAAVRLGLYCFLCMEILTLFGLFRNYFTESHSGKELDILVNSIKMDLSLTASLLLGVIFSYLPRKLAKKVEWLAPMPLLVWFLFIGIPYLPRSIGHLFGH
jgi:hypothetical protein